MLAQPSIPRTHEPRISNVRKFKVLTVLFASGAILFVGVILNAPSLYWMAGSLMALPVASRLLSWAQVRGLAARRRLPAQGNVGDWLEVTLEVENLTRWPRLMLSVADMLPPGLEADPAAPIPVQLLANGTDEAHYRLRLRRRGLYMLESVQLLGTDLLELRVSPMLLPAPQELVVYPRIVAIDPEIIPGGAGYAPWALATSPLRGQNVTPYGTRNYLPGDPIKQIHWPTTARRGQLTVVEREAEQGADLVLAVDARRQQLFGDDAETTLEAAIALAASLAAEVLRQGETVQLLIPGQIGLTERGARRADALGHVLWQLARIQETDVSFFGRAVTAETAALTQGARVCLLTAAPEEETIQTLSVLKGGRLSPILYAFDGPTFTGAPPDPRWEAVMRAARSLDIPCFHLRRNDPLTRRLIDEPGVAGGVT